jgi:methyl-accepting chemotaxis protein
MNLDTLRLRSTYLIAGVGIVMAVAGVITEFYAQGAFGPASMLCGAAAALLLGMAMFTRGSQAFRYLAVSVLMAEVMGLLIAARGYSWQTDMHMAFFAALALCALMYDVKAIVLGAVLVAVHHLVLGMLLENLVFFGGGSIPRVVLHAVLISAEAAGLIWLTLTTRKLLDFAADKSAEAAGEASKARELADAAESERRAWHEGHHTMLERLEASFGEVLARASAGDFTARVDTDLDDAVLNRLAGNVNTLVATVGNGLEKTGEMLAALARTDLTHRVEGHEAGAFEQLRVDANAVAETLTGVVAQLRQTSRSLKTATGEMLSGANDLAERTTKQAATIQETSATVEQLAVTVAANAKRADEARGVAGSVTRTAEEGGLVMHQATEAMDRITQSSAKISNIIGLIDDIAFQTNLLALNASVEAARAGDAGKGFAVVAIEVRRLAQSAAKASADVKVLIEQSGTEVSGGSRLVADAAAKLETMLAAARSSNALMDGIARESREQAVAVEGVSRAVRQLDEMTQHNAALVQETNAAIEQTEAQASELDRVVAVFTLADSPAPVMVSAPVARRPLPVPNVRELQSQVRSAARSYLSKGNAALKDDWSEF